MDRAEAHRIARILAGTSYDGGLINSLIDSVRRAEQTPTVDKTEWDRQVAEEEQEEFYRGKQFRVTVTSTIETPACSRWEGESCEHCHAGYGHKRFCPLISRETAEAWSAFNNPSEQDRIHAHALGVKL